MIKKYAQAKVIVYDGIQWDGKARTQRIITEWLPDSDIRMNSDMQIEIIDPESGREIYANVGAFVLKTDSDRVFVLTDHNIEHNFVEI